MSSVTSEIASLKSTTAYNSYVSSTTSTTSTDDDDDYTMFLTLMLEQLENQDPTDPVDNSEWLSQLAQYSTLEQMTEMNANMETLMESIDDFSSAVSSNAIITQTLSLVGKDVTIEYEATDDDGNTTTGTVTGVVTEATFDSDGGYVKVGDTYYSIGYVTAVREASTEESE